LACKDSYVLTLLDFTPLKSRVGVVLGTYFQISFQLRC
jgi:hypothetical protein